MTLAYRLGTDRFTDSLHRLPASDSYVRDGLTEKEVHLRGNLSVRTARVTRPLLDPAHVLLFAGLVLHAARVRRPKAEPKPPGRHRAPDAPRHGNGIAWWIWTCVATGYAWLTWRMAVIELPTMTGVGAGMTLALAYTAGRTRRSRP